jgi:hypothetical protein
MVRKTATSSPRSRFRPIPAPALRCAKSETDDARRAAMLASLLGVLPHAAQGRPADHARRFRFRVDEDAGPTSFATRTDPLAAPPAPLGQSDRAPITVRLEDLEHSQSSTKRTPKTRRAFRGLLHQAEIGTGEAVFSVLSAARLVSSALIDRARRRHPHDRPSGRRQIHLDIPLGVSSRGRVDA